MKKIFGFIFLSLFWNSIAMSGCSDDIDHKAEFFNNNKNVEFIFRNKSKNSIVITYFGIMTSDGTFIKKKEEADGQEVYLKPFGVERPIMFTGDINTEVVGQSGYGCRYGTRVTSTENKKSFNSGRKAGDPVYDSADPVGLFKFFRNPVSLIVIALIVGIIIFVNKLNKRSIVDKKQKAKRKSVSENFVEKVWNGHETMSKTFWLYCILSVGVISLIGGLLFYH